MNSTESIKIENGQASGRIPGWDNLKLLLILLVVMGHALHELLDYSDMAQGLYVFIYSFHMPVFVFTAGVFSRRAVTERRGSMVIEFLLIYLIMKALDCAGDFMTSGKTKFHFFWESGPAWFALAMAAFLVITMLIVNFNWKYMLIMAIFVGCLAGLDSHFGDHLASMRICVFYPVFLAGFIMDAELPVRFFSGTRGGALRIASAAVFFGWLAICIFAKDAVYPFLKLFKGKYEYAEMDMGPEGVLMRLVCYAFWALMIGVLLSLTCTKERSWTWFGKRTMAIFIWHGIVLTILLQVLGGTALITTWLPHLYVAGMLCISCIVAIVCAYLPEFRVHNYIKSSHLP